MTNRPGPAAPRPAAPSPVARGKLLRAPLRPNRGGGFGISPPVPAAARISPRVHHQRSVSSSSFLFPTSLLLYFFTSLLLCSFERQRYFKPRPMSILHRALPIHLAAELGDASRHNRQTQSCSLRLSCEKRLQDFLSQCCRYSRPIVFDVENTSPIVRSSTHGDVSPAQRGLQSIHHQVGHHVVHRFRTSRHHGAPAGNSDLHLHASPLRLVRQDPSHLFHDHSSIATAGRAPSSHRGPAELQQ